MLTSPIPKLIPARQLQRRYRAVIDAVKRSRDAVVLVHNNVPEAVLLDLETYDHLVRDDYAYDEARTLRLVEQARRSYRAGKARVLHSWNDLDRR